MDYNDEKSGVPFIGKLIHFGGIKGAGIAENTFS